MGEKNDSLPFKGLLLTSLVAVLLLASATQARASDGGYLNALKAEANSDNPTITPTIQGKENDDGRPTPRTDDQPQMESWLKANYVGSYMFYQKLSDPKKRAVYRLYRSGAEITKIREKINELLKQ
ncbi:hypothetical protein [Thiohalomonas denitrificans]|uniref:Uncharacterized protein n=1 Tax=Thiohalomonas denitrificans TaxID=415747 RepID=A0A1G5QKM1_9GAMM|nr:hypothetical protein [Thiohalomonas denitrificans]SCZ61699.1 hypothetical protein SAMN03097708_02184 [Thiohalomonas denitrificans]